jgi:hypothetical protein
MLRCTYLTGATHANFGQRQIIRKRNHAACDGHFEKARALLLPRRTHIVQNRQDFVLVRRDALTSGTLSSAARCHAAIREENEVHTVLCAYVAAVFA